MPDAAVSPDVLQALDIAGNYPLQFSLNRVLRGDYFLDP
jgi:hypothetical protein